MNLLSEENRTHHLYYLDSISYLFNELDLSNCSQNLAKTVEQLNVEWEKEAKVASETR